MVIASINKCSSVVSVLMEKADDEFDAGVGNNSSPPLCEL